MIALHFHTTVHHMSGLPAALLSILLRDGGLCDWARHQIHMSMRRLLTDASAILLRNLMLKSQACPCGNRSGVNYGPYFSGLCCAGPRQTAISLTIWKPVSATCKNDTFLTVMGYQSRLPLQT